MCRSWKETDRLEAKSGWLPVAVTGSRSPEGEFYKALVLSPPPSPPSHLTGSEFKIHIQKALLSFLVKDFSLSRLKSLLKT